MKFFPKFTLLSIIALLAAALSSCQQSPPIKGLPKRLPVINLHGSAETPPHSMAQNEYPFDENGDYKTEWLASNGGGSSGDIDDRTWRSSHGGEPTPQRDYTPPPKKKPVSKKTTSSSRSSSTKSKSKSGSSKSKSAPRSSSYTVKSGDTLSRIAARNGTTVSKLKAANGLKSDAIRSGKTLKIPR